MGKGRRLGDSNLKLLLDGGVGNLKGGLSWFGGEGTIDIFSINIQSSVGGGGYIYTIGFLGLGEGIGEQGVEGSQEGEQAMVCEDGHGFSTPWLGRSGLE